MVSYPIVDDYLTIIIIFYIVLLTPTISSVIGCHLDFINKNLFLKYALSFLILYFVIVAKDANLVYSPLQKFFLCIPIFVLILIISKIEALFIFSIIFIFFAIYFLVLNREYYNLPANVNKTWISLDYPISIHLFPFQSYQNTIIHSMVIILCILAIFIFLFGIVIYYVKLSYLNPNKKINVFSLFFYDYLICKKPTKTYLEYFKRGILTIF